MNITPYLAALPAAVVMVAPALAESQSSSYIKSPADARAILEQVEIPYSIDSDGDLELKSENFRLWVSFKDGGEHVSADSTGEITGYKVFCYLASGDESEKERYISAANTINNRLNALKAYAATNSQGKSILMLERDEFVMDNYTKNQFLAILIIFDDRVGKILDKRESFGF